MQKRPLHILVADDDDDDQFIIKEAISEYDQHPITITPVYDGAQLLDFLHKKSYFREETRQRPDLILLDINMPVLNGIQALVKIKENPEFRDIPVFMISTVRCEKHYSDCLGMGALDFYSKPNHIGEYRNILENILSRTVLHQAPHPAG